MHAAIWIIVIVWLFGLFALIARGWYFQLQMLNNPASGANSLWSARNGMFDSTRYNAKGQIHRRKLLKLSLAAIAYGLGGVILLATSISLLGGLN